MSTYNDEYEKLSLLGQGAFASIWKVRHRRLGYVRALKELNMGIENEDSPAFISFLNECGLLMRIGNGAHPGIVRVYQPRLISNKATVEMDFVDGLTINEYIREKIFVGFDEVMRFVREVTDALAYCHVDVYKDMMNPLEDQLKRNPDDARQFIINQDDEQRLIQKYGVVHNDLHSNNIMVQGDELLLIDVDDACVGDPAVDLAGMYTAHEITSSSDEVSMWVLGMNAAESKRYWTRFKEVYFDGMDEKEIAALTFRMKFFGNIKFLYGIMKTDRELSVDRNVLSQQIMGGLKQMMDAVGM